MFILFARLRSKILRVFWSVKTSSDLITDTSFGLNISDYQDLCVSWLIDVRRRSERLPPISFVYRLKNADPFLELSVSSVAPLAREIVFVDNGSEDNTKAIIKRLQKKYEGIIKFKLLDYSSIVCSQGVGYQACLTESPEGSLARFYNFCFDAASHDYVFKIDAHKIVLPSSYGAILDFLVKKPGFVFIRGEDYMGRDIGYEPLLYNKSLGVRYVDGDRYEQLNYKPYVNAKDIYKNRIDRVSFIHLKSLLYSSNII